MFLLSINVCVVVAYYTLLNGPSGIENCDEGVFRIFVQDYVTLVTIVHTLQ